MAATNDDQQQSAYEAAVCALREKFSVTAVHAPVCGPREFVEGMIERSDALRSRSSLGPFLKMRANDLPDLEFLKEATDPWRELRVLYVRAFQSMHSRKDLKAFVIALGDGRFSRVPVDLARIDPVWCDEAHALYGHCWRSISRADDAAQRKRGKSEQALGRAVIRQVVRAAGIGGNKAAAKVVERLAGHAATAELVGRLARIMREGNTSDLMNDAIAHAQALYTSGDIDVARLVREGIRLAQKQGVDPAESIAQVSGMLDKYGGMVASMGALGGGGGGAQQQQS